MLRTNRWVLSSKLAPGTYYWRVLAMRPEGGIRGEWSQIGEFTVRPSPQSAAEKPLSKPRVPTFKEAERAQDKKTLPRDDNAARRGREKTSNKAPRYRTVGGFYRYSIVELKKKSFAVSIRDIHRNLQGIFIDDSPRAVFVPIKFSGVQPGHSFTITIESLPFPFLAGGHPWAISYFDAQTEVQTGAWLPGRVVGERNISLELWQGKDLDYGPKSGVNSLRLENNSGIWGDVLTAPDYSKPLVLLLNVRSLGKDFLGVGPEFPTAELDVTMVVADSAANAIRIINEKRQMGAYVAVLSAFGE